MEKVTLKNNCMKSITQIIEDSIDVKIKLANDENIIQIISTCVDIIVKAFNDGNKVLFCGNGGSAADAQHLAAEFSGRFYKDRKALPSEALHCNSSYLTAVGNDYGYQYVYSRLLEGVAKKGDILICLSTSGNSENILNALEVSQRLNVISIGLTGKGGGKMKDRLDYLIDVPSSDTPRIQESHIMIGHIICELVERNLFPNE